MLSNSARKLPAPKPSITLSLDELVEERPRGGVVIQPGRVLQENLQQVRALAVAVDQDFEFLQLVSDLRRAADAELFQARGSAS